MSGSRDLKVVILGDAKGAERAFQTLANAGDKVGSRLKAVGTAVATGVAAATAGVAAFATKSVMAASDLNEVLSKSNTIFGDSAKEIEKWAGGAAASFGQSKRQALEAAGTFGNMFTQLGVGSEQAAKMSKQMTELGSDFASFHNADPSEVLNAMTAAFRGEYDAVQRFVPTINAAAVEHQALAMGLGKTTKELDAQDKALATQALLLQGAGAAAGDFDRTNDGLANKIRILKSRAEDFAGAVGTKLLPVVLSALEMFDKIAPVVQMFGRSLVAAFRDPDVTSDGLIGVAERIGVALRRVVDFVQTRVIPAFIGIGTWWNQNGPAITDAVGRVVRFVMDVFDRVKPSITKVTRAFQDAFADITSKGDQFREAISHVWNFIQGLWAIVGDDILRVTSRVFNAVSGVISAVMQVIRGVIQTVLAIINGDWGKAWDGIKGILAGVWNAIYAVISGALGVVKSILGAGLGVIGTIWSAAWDGIKGAFGAVWDGIKSIAVSAVNFMTQNVINPLIRGLNTLITGFNRLPGVPNLPHIAEIARIASGSRGADTSVSLGGGGSIRAMAEGGSGTVSKPTLFLAGEAGTEDYQFVPHSKGGLAGSGTIENHIYLDGREIAVVVTNHQRRLARAQR